MTAERRGKQVLAAEVMEHVLQLHKERLRTSAAGLRPYDLTVQQLYLLNELPEHEGLPIGAIAEAMHCHGSNVTGLVDRLEARGLVARLPSAADRRVRYVELTDTGRALRRELAGVGAGPPQVLLDRLDGEQLTTLNRLLGQVCSDLD